MDEYNKRIERYRYARACGCSIRMARRMRDWSDKRIIEYIQKQREVDE